MRRADSAAPIARTAPQIPDRLNAIYQEEVNMKLRVFSVLLCAGLLHGESKPAAPKLDLVFDLHLELGKPTDVGQIGPAGSRRIVPVAGGTLEGPGLKGKILPGADYQIIHPDGLVELDAHYVVQMENGDLLYVNNRGMRHGPAEVIQKLNSGQAVDQSLIYFRTVVSIETASPS